jgi:iron(III) transport system substrate-binding protein
MRWQRRISTGALLALLALALACGPTATPAPSGSSGAAGTAPAPAAGAAQPSGAGAGAQPGAVTPDWQAEWERTVAAARQEGKLAVSAPVGDIWRAALMAFQEDYPEIALELLGFNSRDFWPRVRQERQADQYLWDLRIGGPDPTVFDAIGEGLLAPVRPLLVLPEVTDDSKWLQGLEGSFFDDQAQYLLSFFAYTTSPADVNREFVPESDLRSDGDLLDPKWRGKISIQSPRGGSGILSLSVLLVAYGEDYVRDLLTRQEVTVNEDSRQQAEWLVRGRYPIGIGAASAQILRFQQQGVGKQIEALGGRYMGVTSGVGGIQFLSKPPHPNAAKLFVNWILTPRVQARLAKETELNSRRLDVPPGDPARLPDPNRLDQYVPTQAQKHVRNVERALQIVTETLK